MTNQAQKRRKAAMDSAGNVCVNHEAKLLVDTSRLRQWSWKRPVGSTYAMLVTIWPGTVVITGDCGEAIFRMTEGTRDATFSWLASVSGAHETGPSWDYALGKVQNRMQDEFLAEDAMEWLVESAAANSANMQEYRCVRLVLELEPDIDINRWIDICALNGISEPNPCKDFNSQHLFQVAMLGRFCRAVLDGCP